MKILVLNWNNVLTDVMVELKKRGHKIYENQEDYKKTKVVVIWNEIDLPGWRYWIQKARKAGNRIVLVQHGRRGSSRIFPPFNEKLISDVVCVWGQNDVGRLVSCGFPKEKIVVTGTPIFKGLKKQPHEGINIIFSPEHWDHDVAENSLVAGQLRKLKDVKVITKILEGEHDSRYYQNPISSDRHSSEHLRIVSDVLSIADLVVGISESTFELMAEILDIPVIIADIWKPKSCNGDDRYKTYHREYSNACTKAKLEDLNKVIELELISPGRLSKERKEIAELDGGVNEIDPLENIIKVIENKI